jgi:1-carboxybiuret hydrolase
MTELAWASASAIAAAVTSGEISATDVIDQALARIAQRNEVLNAFTAVTAERARARATAIDAVRAAGKPVGPLAGVPFAVKNLIDIAGLPTVAGSKINRAHPPSAADGTGPPLGGSRCGVDRRAEYGRIRVRLHRRELPRRCIA